MSSIEENKMDFENKEETKDIPFNFQNLEVLSIATNVIHNHTVSSYKQITATSVQCLSYVCSYTGLKGCEWYLFDLSPGATGKDSAFDKAYEVFLKPVMDLQNERKALYDYERQSSDEKLPLKSFHCIHTSDATEQGVYEGFMTTNAQFIAIGENSNKLRKKEDSLTNFTTRYYGKNTLTLPNYKKDLGTYGSLTVDGISLFYYGNSNLKMLGRNIFTHHIVGGLLNRCTLVYNTSARSFEERPESYDLEQGFIEKMHIDVHNLIRYGEVHKNKPKPLMSKTEEYVAFDRYIFDLTNKYAGSEVEYFFKRVIQNLNAIIYTFHYLVGSQNKVWNTEVKASTISLGINYMKYILAGYTELIDEIIGATAEVRDEVDIKKLHATILSLSKKKSASKLLHRDVYRAAHITRKQYDRLLLSMNYKTDKKYLHVATYGMTTVTWDKMQEVA